MLLMASKRDQLKKVCAVNIHNNITSESVRHRVRERAGTYTYTARVHDVSRYSTPGVVLSEQNGPGRRRARSDFGRNLWDPTVEIP